MCFIGAPFIMIDVEEILKEEDSPKIVISKYAK